MNKYIFFIVVFFYNFSYSNSSLFLHTLKDYQPKKHREILVIVPSYNNKDWYKKNIDSIMMQDYKNYHVVYIDDCSSDGTGELVDQYVKNSVFKKKFTIIKNQQNQGALANYYNAIHSWVNNNAIVAILDGDDWLANNHVFSLLNKIYDKYDVWITYGSHKKYPSGKIGCARKVPDYIIEQNAIREYKWVTSQLRTFYVWLFKLIKKDDLCVDGHFFSKSGDVGIMIPMIEMAGHHSKFIPDIIYIYNRATPLNGDKLNPGFTMTPLIRAKEKYLPLDKNYT